MGLGGRGVAPPLRCVRARVKARAEMRPNLVVGVDGHAVLRLHVEGQVVSGREYRHGTTV